MSVTSHFGLITPLLSAFFGGQDLTLMADGLRPDQGPSERRRGRSSPTPTPTPNPTPTPTPTVTPTPDPMATPTPTPTSAPTPDADALLLPADRRLPVHAERPGRRSTRSSGSPTLSTTTPECPLTWSWNFGDGAGASSTSDLQNPTHIYQSQGVLYTITLVVSNLGGNDTRTRTVTVTP